MGVEGKVRAERDLVRALELTEELVQLKLALGDKIREGTFQFSRQRYARGPHAVSEIAVQPELDAGDDEDTRDTALDRRCLRRFGAPVHDVRV
jgi:hypothetical protein